jgi:hypothetical protein
LRSLGQPARRCQGSSFGHNVYSWGSKLSGDQQDPPAVTLALADRALLPHVLASV